MATCIEFLEYFVLPLVAGGPMHVGKPIDAKQLGEFETQLPHSSVPLVAIDDARERVLSGLAVEAPSLVLDLDELSLAAAVHNLLYLAHPEAEGISTKARNKVIAVAQSFAARPRTTRPRRIMARHALLHNLFSISRNDLRIAWWTGSADFLGQPAPQRLLRWQDLRRVQQTESSVGFDDLFKGADVTAVLVALMRRSPLTLLLDSSSNAPHLHWEDAVFLLRDARLCRSVAYAAVSGTSWKAKLAGPQKFAASFEQMLERSPKAMDLRTVAAFLVYLNYLLVLDEIKLRDKSPLVAAAFGSQLANGLATFFALPAALRALNSRMATPPGLLDDPQLAARWKAHQAQVLEALGDGYVDRLRQQLAGMLESPPLLEDGTAPN